MKYNRRHIQRLNEVLTILNDAGLKLSLEKCKFFQKEVEYLGMVVSKGGVSISNEKIKAIEKRPYPLNQNELRSFCGLVN